MNPEQERRHHHHEGVNLQPPEYEPRDPTLYGPRPLSGPFWWVLGGTLAVVAVLALAIWWFAS